MLQKQGKKNIPICFYPADCSQLLRAGTNRPALLGEPPVRKKRGAGKGKGMVALQAALQDDAAAEAAEDDDAAAEEDADPLEIALADLIGNDYDIEPAPDNVDENQSLEHELNRTRKATKGYDDKRMQDVWRM